MTISPLKKVLLVLAIQAVAITATFCLDHTRLDWLAMIGCFAAFLVPFPGYIIALYHAPMRLASSKTGRMAVLTLLSFFLTVFGGGFVSIVLLFTGVPSYR